MVSIYWIKTNHEQQYITCMHVLLVAYVFCWFVNDTQPSLLLTEIDKTPTSQPPIHGGPFPRNMWSREHTSITCYPRRRMCFFVAIFFHARKWKVMGRLQREAGGCEVWSEWLFCNTRWYDTGWYYSPHFYLLEMKRFQGRFEGQWCSLVHVVAWKISEEITSISLYSAWWNADGLVPSFVSGG